VISGNGSIDVTGASSLSGLSLSGGAVTVAGGQTLTLDNVTMNGSVLSIGALGQLIATGTTVIDNVNNSGTLIENGGILHIDGDVTGAGSAIIENGGTIAINGSFAQTVNFSGTGGTLLLDKPLDFTGQIDGLAVGDIIDLAGLTVTSAVIGTVNGVSVLTATENNGQTLTYQIAGALAGNGFSIQTDHAGGTDLILSHGPPTWAGDTLDAYNELSFDGSSKSITWNSGNFTVPAGNISADFNLFKLSVADTTITVSDFLLSGFWFKFNFNGLIVTDLTQGNISGVVIDPSTNMVGLTASDVSFTSNTVMVNWAGLSFNPNTVVRLDLTFDPPLDPSTFATIPVLDGSDASAVNTGTLTVADGTALALAGTIDNSGVISVAAAAAVTAIEIDGDVTLQGGGHIELSESNQNYVFGTDATLINVDNTITGSGDFGNGTLAFQNAGVVEALGPYALIIDTGGASFVNTGTLETGGGTLMIHSPVTGEGNALIAGGTLEFFGASDNNVTFDASVPGLLVLDQSQNFTGQISGFSGQDQIDLSDIVYAATTTFDYVANSNDTGGVLVVRDGTHLANLAMVGEYTSSSFAISSDGHGGTMLADSLATTIVQQTDSGALNSENGPTDGTVTFAGFEASGPITASATPQASGYIGNFTLGPVSQHSDGSVSIGFEFAFGDQVSLSLGESLTQSYSVTIADAQNPAAQATQTISVSIGGPGNDKFVFQPGVGADTVTNFNPQTDTIEFDHFANVQTPQQLEALITTNTHGDAVIDLGHNDSVTLTGVTLAQLQHMLTTSVLVH